MYDPADVQSIVETLTEAEADCHLCASGRTPSSSGVARIAASAAYGGYELPVRARVEAERGIARSSTVGPDNTFSLHRAPAHVAEEVSGPDRSTPVGQFIWVLL